MSGLISNAMSSNTTPPVLDPGVLSQATSTGIDPQTRTVDAAKETVSGQLDTLLQQGSPYIDRARAASTVAANKRGLINSSIAAGAGEGAAIDAALPIANADAGIYGTAARDNQSVGNAALQFNADAANKASLVNMDASNQFGLQDLKGSQATDLANIEANYKSLIQTSSSASQYYTAVTNSLAAVMADPKTTPEQKQLAVDKITQQLQAGLTVIGGIGNIDIAGLLDFSGSNPALNSTSSTLNPDGTPTTPAATPAAVAPKEGDTRPDGSYFSGGQWRTPPGDAGE